MNRREWIGRSALLATGILGGICAPQLLHKTRAATPDPALPVFLNSTAKTTTALSLKTFQQQARSARSRGSVMPADLANLGGLNRITSFTIENDGDIILLGDRDSQYPRFHIDDLAVSIRSAFLKDGLYNIPLGCSIDPGANPNDPWSIQTVRVFGPQCHLTGRAVKLDYELKLAGASLVKIPGVRSSFELWQSEAFPCDARHEKTTDVTNRYWFCSRVARASDGPRYEASDRTVTIRKPVHVQVLTERRLKSHGNSEVGGTPDPTAERFAQEVSALLAAETQPRREYLEIRNDFRLIEVGALLRTRDVPMDLDYLLKEHELEHVDIPRYVSGISRKETSEVSCNGTITEAAGSIESRSQMRQETLSYRGGVDARVDTPPEQFTVKPPDAYTALRANVQEARPSTGAWIWSIASS